MKDPATRLADGLAAALQTDGPAHESAGAALAAADGGPEPGNGTKKKRYRPKKGGAKGNAQVGAEEQAAVGDGAAQTTGAREPQKPAKAKYAPPSKKKRQKNKAAQNGQASANGEASTAGSQDGRKKQSSNASNASSQPEQQQKEERDPIHAPSEASGGVPEPAAAYLQQASRPLGPRASAPHPLLVVIDLNGTLLHRPSRRRAPKAFVARPHASRFLSYCVDTFWVVIWSSARPDNVAAMCKQLLRPDQLARVVAIWGRDRFGLSPDDYNSRVQCYKRLSHLWADPVVAAAHPAAVATSTTATPPGAPLWSQANTVLIDDSLEKARSEPHNLIAIPEFAGDVGDAPNVLPRVHDYINELCFQPDVSAYMRAHPFQTTEQP